MQDHILDRPIWSSLTSVHAQFAVGVRNARRFQDDINPLGAARDESPQSLADLAELIPPGGHIVTAQAEPIVVPPGTHAVITATVAQMLQEGEEARPSGRHAVERLVETDAAEMLALVELTKPGPYSLRASRLGEYWGIKLDGRLVAMAGERMKQPGFTEISGVCTHPDFQGRGLGRELCLTLLARLAERGETPYLHAFSSNARAIGLYETLGFRIRRQLNVAQIERD